MKNLVYDQDNFFAIFVIKLILIILQPLFYDFGRRFLKNYNY